MSGITTDAASTTFNGSRIALTVTRQDGSTLRLDSARHTFTSEAYTTTIPGHTRVHGYALLDYSNSQGTVGAVYVSWDNTDSLDYLAGGYWLHATGNFSAGTITGVEVGAFVDGPEINGPASLPVSGRATYQGATEGFYAQIWGTDDPDAAPGSSSIGAFAATIDLTANFGSNTISGCVGCTGTVELAGVFEDGRTGEAYEVSGYSDAVVRLGPTPISADGSFRGRQMSMTTPDFVITGTTGSWGGQFSNRADSSGDPRLVAGTYGGKATTSGGTQSVFVGAFAPTKR